MISCIKRNNRENCVNPEMESTIYHEKQTKEMCALHALNNLFQDPNAFSRKQLDETCFRLSPNNFINPHKSVLGLGNYDVNVIMASLQTKGFEAIWFDKRKKLEYIVLENVLGFILNIPTEYKWGIFRLPFHRKHWFGIREIFGVYYNLDSKLDAPEIIGKRADLLAYLEEQILDRDKELLLVVRSTVAEVRSWYYEPDLTAEINSDKNCPPDEDRLKIDTANCAIEENSFGTFKIADVSMKDSMTIIECQSNGNHETCMSRTDPASSKVSLDTKPAAPSNGLCKDLKCSQSDDSTGLNHLQSVGVS